MSQMLSRSSKGVAGLLSCPVTPSYRKCSSPSTLRLHDVLVRSQHTDGEPENNSTESTKSTESTEDTKPQPRRYRSRLTHHLKPRRERFEKVPISVTSLGNPGEVVVVPHPKRRRFVDVEHSKDRTDESKDALPFMLKDIEDADEILDSDLVTERIESFRTLYRPGDKLSPAEWENLRLDFQTSFTNQQLSDYIEEFKADNTVSEGGLALDGGAKYAEWRPGTSAFFETESAPQAGAAKRVATSLDLRGKYLLTERVLRDCWHLGLVGEVGQLDIRLPAHSLSLFLHSEHFSFEELAGLHDAKIDITHSLGLVRITGRLDPCEAIRDIIYDAMTRIREEDLQLYPPGTTPKGRTRVFTADFLSWVSKTYGVSFDLTSTTPTKMFYLVENKPKAESARRTLNLAIHDATQPPIPFGTYMAASEPIETYDINPELNVSWADRQKSWFRWAVPSAQTTSSSMSDTPFFNKHEMRLSDELLKLLRARARTNLGNTQAHESITAAVGRCLFQHKPFDGKAITAAQLGKLAPLRTFTTDMPRVIPFLQQLATDFQEEEIQLHRLRLVPSAVHANIFPQLELDVGINPGGFETEYNVQNAKAILSQSSVDYLLPECSLDLRFTRTLTHDVLENFGVDRPLEPLQGSLRDFFSKAMNYEGETPLPAFSQLSIPNHLLVETGEERDPDGFTTAEYMYLPVNDFRGTRLHQYDFENHRLNYSFYESGPFSAHRTTDIFLDVDMTDASEQAPKDSNSQEPVQQGFNAFYKAACSLAFDLDRSGRAM